MKRRHHRDPRRHHRPTVTSGAPATSAQWRYLRSGKRAHWPIQNVSEGPLDAETDRCRLIGDGLWRQRQSPTDVLSQRRSSASAASLRMQLPPDARRTRRTGLTNGRCVTRVMRHLYTPPTGSAVPYDAQTLRCQGLLRADRPARAHIQPGARRPGRPRSGRASGVANGLPAHDVPVAGRELHATRGGGTASSRPERRVGIKNLGVGVYVINRE